MYQKPVGGFFRRHPRKRGGRALHRGDRALSKERVLATDEALLRIVGVDDIEQVRLVEEAEVDRSALDERSGPVIARVRSSPNSSWSR